MILIKFISKKKYIQQLIIVIPLLVHGILCIENVNKTSLNV